MTKATTLLYIGLGAAVGFVGGVLAGRATAPQVDASQSFGIRLEGRPLRGPKNAPVTIVEFTDYECSFCRRYTLTTYPVLLDQYGDRVSYTVRHYPVSYQHRRAHKAAQAAECAGDQGKFFEYHEMLFRNSRALDEASLLRYAAMMRLNTEVFEDCLESGVKSDVVDDDIQAPIARGLAGTPSFLINGRVLFGAQPTEVFQRAIDRELRGD
jgi:protein-disulfide isomerase